MQSIPQFEDKKMQDLMKQLESMGLNTPSIARSPNHPDFQNNDDDQNAIPQFNQFNQFQPQMIEDLLKGFNGFNGINDWGSNQQQRRHFDRPSKASLSHQKHQQFIDDQKSLQKFNDFNHSKIIDLRNDSHNHFVFRFDEHSRTTMKFMEDLFTLESMGIFGTFLVEYQMARNRKMAPLLEFIQSKGHIIAYESFEELSNKDTSEMIRILENVEWRIYSAIGKRPFFMSHSFNDIYAQNKGILRDKLDGYLQIKFEGESVRSGARMLPQIGLEANWKPMGQCMDEMQRQRVCRQYDCVKELENEQSIFYKMCTFNLQCDGGKTWTKSMEKTEDYLRRERRQEMDIDAIHQFGIHGDMESVVKMDGGKPLSMEAEAKGIGNQEMESLSFGYVLLIVPVFAALFVLTLLVLYVFRRTKFWRRRRRKFVHLA